ncbi:TOBE domain-containing protein [Herminiimonas fonticola]|uniref:Molybdate transport system regulatory protein n=1 Tax=Herminiimonas fonticola TaxID=303380 RepID=A0A4R6GG10_9BURK|nr:TOBE domain-containing protein [Herminiimonas fonticola]RBA24600.1 Mop: molybdenum-pterin binding domain [Herminiimonas fonticola]TDN93717.1 molybdate transport system regulatory protein [Herminiimonas fonticola]
MSKSDSPIKLEGLSKARGKRWDHLELLERIDASGSISSAATAMGMSYKAAWQAVEAINNLSHEAVLIRQPGGSTGGGTCLTEYGRRMVATYRRLEQEWAAVPAALGRTMDDFDQYYTMSRRFDMQTSARNQFLGTVTAVKMGAVNAEIILDIGRGEELAAIITNDSAEHLALEVGSEAYALVKAQWIILAVGDDIKTSARNRLTGTVVRCQEGAVNAEVVIELPGGKTVASIITNESVKVLGLKEGVRASALIKASHIILAVAS